jgi:5-methyltetrahydropteroyltriglutamate--homocysteine methyltransferase
VALFREFGPAFGLGLGVIDVKVHEVESAAVVAERVRQAMKLVPAERLSVNPDCGLMHLPRDVAFAKLAAMVEGARLVRRELGAG